MYTSDHHYPGSRGAPIVLVLYANLADPQGAQFHRALKRMAERRQIDYVLRHFDYNEVGGVVFQQ